MHRVKLLSLLLAVLLVAFPGTVAAKKYKPINEIPGQVPETEEEEAVWQVGIAHQEEVRGGQELVNNAELEQYLEGIVARLMGDMVATIGLEVDVLVFREPTVNAWVYPNGTVAVQTGMLAAMDNEAQLAAILGHEVSHFLNRHAFIQIKSKQTQSAIGKGLGALAAIAVAVETGTIATGLLDTGQIWTDLVTSGYSR
ncbi:MAG: M48 family metalloprotease, partial [Halioglobus sp.]|nr:M48 family metalloprotease [Halioglobus sp.]